MRVCRNIVYSINIGITLIKYHRNRTKFVATNGNNYVIFCLITYRSVYASSVAGVSLKFYIIITTLF